MEEKNKGGRPPIFNTPDELQERIDDYKRYLKTSGKPPTIAGLAYYTGIDRQTLYNYKSKDEFFDTIKTFVQWVLMNYEEQAVDKGNAGIIFLLKNYGYQDKQETEISGGLGLEIKWDDQ